MRIPKRIIRYFTLTWLLLPWCAPAFALDAALDMSQYGHTAWRNRDGFAKGYIGAIAQTQDGYLWLGTDAGLMRFDGVRTMPWQSPDGTPLPGNRIRALLAARDGTLWIGTSNGLASWSGSKLTVFHRFDGLTITALVEDRVRTIWVGAQTIGRNDGLLCAVEAATTKCTGEDGSLGWIGAFYESSDRSLWIMASKGVWHWKPGPPKLYSLPVIGGIKSLCEIRPGVMLATTRDGIAQVARGKVEALILPSVTSNTTFTSLLCDRGGGLWIGTLDEGLLHFHQGRIDRFQHSDDLSNDRVVQMFEDREGNVWTSTLDGLDRFRALPATTYTKAQSFGGTSGASVLADRDGSIWLDSSQGLYRWRNGSVLAYRAQSQRLSPSQAAPAREIVLSGLPERPWASLFQDYRGRIWVGSQSGLGYIENVRFTPMRGVQKGYIDAIAEDREDTLWIAHRGMGLLRLSPDLRMQNVPLKVAAKTGNASRLAVDSVRGGLWLGFFSGGIAHFVDGRIDVSYSAKDGLGKNAVNDIRVAADGTVWVATDGGLSRIKGGRIATLTEKSGLPCNAVHASLVDDANATWAYTACGLVRIARADLDAWATAVDQAKAPPTIPMFVLSNADGVHSFPTPGSTATPHLTKARDGRLWFITIEGMTVVDPRNLHLNTLPPPVHVEQIVADRRSYDIASRIRLPPLVRDLEIDYTALSLVAPERNQFRYKLEGHDRDWHDAGNRRQAFFTDLAPGNYRFHVIASNNSGVWNKEGETLAFTIAPAYWQTTWFQILVATTLALLLATVYRIRMRQVARAAAHEQEIELRHRALQTELAHANRVATMGQLTASIAHEVNQPIAATITNAKAALRWLAGAPPDLEEVRDALTRIARDGDRAGEIIGRIRALAKKAPPQKDRLNINDAIREVIDLTYGEAAKNGVSLQIDLEDGLPPVYGDRVQLQQVMLNLIVNAIQAMAATDDGPRELFIGTAKNGPDRVIVTVRDTGPGLPPAMRDSLFEAFQTTKPGGLGLGLSICHSIVEAHGGELTAKANAPRGAVFQFTVPVQEERLGSDR